jgi:hypothetical protein
MVRATYAVEVDWDNDGAYGHDEVDITADVLDAVFSRGRDRSSPVLGQGTAGRMSLTVRNETGKYSKNNTGSDVAGLQLPGRLIRVRTTAPGSAVTLWTGYVERFTPVSVGLSATTTITAVGSLAQLHKKITIASLTDPTVKAILDDILDDAGWAAGLRSLDTGQTTLNRIWFHDRIARNAFYEVVDSDGGFVYESAAGNIVFEDRHHRLLTPHTVSQATWSDAAGASLSYMVVEESDPHIEIRNHVRVGIHRFTVGSAATLWNLNQTLTLAIGETQTVWARYPDAGTPSGSYVNAWTTINSSDVSVSGVAFASLGIVLSKFAETMKIQITNNGAATASISAMRARGTPVTQDEPVIAEAEDAASITLFGERSYEFPGPWMRNFNEAQDIANWYLARFKSDVSVLTITRNANRDSASMTDVLARNISDRVTVVANNEAHLGINTDFFIERITHRISQGGTLHNVTYVLAEVASVAGLWTLGVSKLGVGTTLAA